MRQSGYTLADRASSGRWAAPLYMSHWQYPDETIGRGARTWQAVGASAGGGGVSAIKAALIGMSGLNARVPYIVDGDTIAAWPDTCFSYIAIATFRRCEATVRFPLCWATPSLGEKIALRLMTARWSRADSRCREPCGSVAAWPASSPTQSRRGQSTQPGLRGRWGERHSGRAGR